jgi:hypothetical protein
MRISLILALVGAICLPLLHAAPAQAQATRTFISGTGDDTNNCSRTLPCKTLVGAYLMTAAFGEIDCLDSGGFGALTIEKSIMIDCEAVTGGVLVSGTNGITVNVGVNDTVTLKGLDIDGFQSGLSGINFYGAGTLHVENCLIREFNTYPAAGINFQPNGVAKLFVVNSYISDNGNVSGAFGAGILIAPQTGGSASIVLNGVQSNNNVTGFKADGTSAFSSPAIKATILNSAFSGNAYSGIAATTAGSNTVNVMINTTTSSNNATNGVAAQATNATIEISRSTVTGNATGLNATGGGVLLSTGDNQVGGNTTTSNGTIGTAPVL